MPQGKNASDVLKGTVRTVVHLQANEDGKLPDSIQIFPEGSFDTVPYGKMVIDKNVFDQMIANFKLDVRKAVPVDVDHDGGKAAGWINELNHVEGKGLFANVEWTPYGEELLSNKEYRLFSPEWAFDYMDPQHSTRHGAVLIAGSLTNRPLFKDMDFLTASDGSNSSSDALTVEDNVVILISNSNQEKEIPMNLEELLKKDVSELTAEEKNFIKENAEDLSEEKRKAFDFLQAEEADEDAEDEGGEDPVEADEDAEEADEEEDAEEEEANTGDEGDDTVTLSASEVESMKAKISEYKAKEQRIKTEKQVSKFIASDKGGKLLPKSKDKVVDFMLTLSASQREAFTEIVKDLPEVKIAGEEGDSASEPMTAEDKVVKLIDKYKSDDGLTELQAQDKVEADHPNLWAEYRKSV